MRRGTNFLWRDGLNTTFSLRDYDHFKFSWKIEGGRGRLEQFADFPRRLCADRFPRALAAAWRRKSPPLAPTTRGGDQYGEFRAGDWFTADTRLWRRMVLLREGPLVVCDQLQPAAAAAGWQAGPLWHLFAMPEAGPNWYNAAGPEELLVWFAPAPGRTCGMQTARLWSGVQPFTVFAKETLKPGRTAQFISVLAPHRPQTAAGPLAAAIRAESSSEGAIAVELPGGGQSIRVQLGRSGTWSVAR